MKLERAERLIHVIRCRILDNYEGDTSKLERQLKIACRFAKRHSNPAENCYARVMWL